MKENQKIFITGGAGYVGSKLVPKLLNLNFQVTVLDLMIYGEDVLTSHKNLRCVKGDIRDLRLLEKYIPGHDTVIHLACISNDPSFLLNENLSKEINYDSFKDFLKIINNTSLNKLIFASTSSVYGVSEEEDITEDYPKKPITLYNRYKYECEKLIVDQKNSFKSCIIRPATVCGLSSKMRFDLTVNILTNFAYFKKEIKVFGGRQKRPNIHINDMINLYISLIDMKFDTFDKQAFNAGVENLSIDTIAKKVQKIMLDKKQLNVDIKYEKTDDIRSYHVNSDKIQKILKFKFEKNVDDAINDLIDYFDRVKPSDTFGNLNYFNAKKLLHTKFT